jgi:hypothetical protein
MHLVDLEVDLDGMLLIPLMVLEILQLIPIIHKFRDIEVERIMILLTLVVVAVLVVLVCQATLQIQEKVRVVLDFSV